MRGIVLAGMVFVGMLVGMGLYIYSDKIKLLDKHEVAITQLQKK